MFYFILFPSPPSPLLPSPPLPSPHFPCPLSLKNPEILNLRGICERPALGWVAYSSLPPPLIYSNHRAFTVYWCFLFSSLLALEHAHLKAKEYASFTQCCQQLKCKRWKRLADLFVQPWLCPFTLSGSLPLLFLSSFSLIQWTGPPCVNALWFEEVICEEHKLNWSLGCLWELLIHILLYKVTAITTWPITSTQWEQQFRKWLHHEKLKEWDCLINS